MVNQKVLIDDNREKAIIVSQWPSFLYLIREHLAHYNAKMEMFSGAIPISKKNKIIHDFNNHGGPQVIKYSIFKSSVYLNVIIYVTDFEFLGKILLNNLFILTWFMNYFVKIILCYCIDYFCFLTLSRFCYCH